MTDKVEGDRYSRSAVTIHWLMLALIVAAYACILLRENFPRGSDIREMLKTWHFMLGLSVLALSLLRLGLRLTVWKIPAISPPPSRYLVWLSAGAHAAIYALVITMPIAGWLILSAEGKPIPFNLPPLVAPDAVVAKAVEELHEAGGLVGYFVIGLHAAGALFHHLILKDDTLRRMMPPGK